MKTLVTGGAGFLGSHIVEKLCSQGHEVIIIDDLSTGDKRNIEELPARLHVGTIEDFEFIDYLMPNVDCVFHLAAMVSVTRTADEPEKAVAVNTQGTINVLKSLAKNHASKIVFFSSAAVYGDLPELPKREDSLIQPISPYGQTKLDGEFFVKFFAEKYNFDYAIVRAFNAFGPRQRLDSQYSAVIPAFISLALDGKPLTIHGDGAQTRDFIFAEDVADAAIFLSRKYIHSGVYNLAGGSEVSVRKLADTIKKIANFPDDIPIEFDAPRPGDIERSFADISKLNGIGFSSKIELDTGLRKTIDFFTKSDL